jgi:Fe-S-cluster-containing dehydrogenase component
MGAYNTIAFDAAKCDGCGDCMTACATAKTGTTEISRSRIQIGGNAETGFELALCRQCGDPKCVSVCPAGALGKDYASGVIGWDATSASIACCALLAAPTPALRWTRPPAALPSATCVKAIPPASAPARTTP